MVNISFLPLALVAGLAAFGEARNCTPKLNYCGHVLLDVGRYYTTVADELTRATKKTCHTKRQITDSLFYCGANGAIKYRKFCKNGCQLGPSGGHDYCWTD